VTCDPPGENKGADDKTHSCQIATDPVDCDEIVIHAVPENKKTRAKAGSKRY
jgi:hypothetical protein